MNKGRWAIVVVLLVAVGMGIATWPLLKIRRKDEVHRTRQVLRSLDLQCRQYYGEYRKPPASLEALRVYGSMPLIDAWQRPIQFRLKEGPASWEIWSLGANPDDASDDIFERPREAP